MHLWTLDINVNFLSDHFCNFDSDIMYISCWSTCTDPCFPNTKRSFINSENNFISPFSHIFKDCPVTILVQTMLNEHPACVTDCISKDKCIVEMYIHSQLPIKEKHQFSYGSHVSSLSTNTQWTTSSIFIIIRGKMEISKNGVYIMPTVC